MSGRVEATEGEEGGRPVARGLAEIPGLYGVESGGPGRGNTKEIHLITQMRGMIGCRRSDLRKRGKSRFRLPIKKPHFLARVMGEESLVAGENPWRNAGQRSASSTACMAVFEPSQAMALRPCKLRSSCFFQLVPLLLLHHRCKE